MAAEKPLLEVSDNDPIREYTEEEKKLLTDRLSDTTLAIHGGEYGNARFDESLLLHIHRTLFEGIREHAGRHRDVGYGSERLVFGGHLSLPREEVRRELHRVFDAAWKSLRSLEDNRKDPSFEKSAFHLAAWLHGELIRIHPFEDGNGRVCRLLVDLLLVRLSLNPILMEVPRQEYLDALDAYVRNRNKDPLYDLFLRLATESLWCLKL